MTPRASLALALLVALTIGDRVPVAAADKKKTAAPAAPVFSTASPPTERSTPSMARDGARPACRRAAPLPHWLRGVGACGEPPIYLSRRVLFQPPIRAIC